MTDSIFTPDQGEAAKSQIPQADEGNVGNASEIPTTPAAPAIPTELQEFVGEGKKFKTVADYVSGYKNSQEFIDTLKGETATMREELQKRKTAEELLQDMRSTTTEQQKPTSQGVEVNEAVLSEIVAKQIAQKEAAQTQEQNAKTVVQSLGKMYGDKSQEMFNKVAAENDMTPEEFEKLAATKPNMVLNLCGVKQKPSADISIESSINTQSLNTSNQTSDEPSLVLPMHPNSRDLARVWEASKKKVYAKHNITE